MTWPYLNAMLTTSNGKSSNLKLVTESQGCGSSRVYLLSLPSPYKVSRSQVRFQLSSKCFRFHKPASASTSPAPCFMKNAFASGPLVCLQSLLPLPASFFKVLLLPQKFNHFHCFRFHIPEWNWPLLFISVAFGLVKSFLCNWNECIGVKWYLPFSQKRQHKSVPIFF